MGTTKQNDTNMQSRGRVSATFAPAYFALRARSFCVCVALCDLFGSDDGADEVGRVVVRSARRWGAEMCTASTVVHNTRNTPHKQPAIIAGLSRENIGRDELQTNFADKLWAVAMRSGLAKCITRICKAFCLKSSHDFNSDVRACFRMPYLFAATIRFITKYALNPHDRRDDVSA